MSNKIATLDLRLSPEQKELIRKAAAIRGQSMSEFVLAAAEPVAAALVDRQEVIELSQGAWREFVQMVERPGTATPLARQEAAEFLREFPDALNRPTDS